MLSALRRIELPASVQAIHNNAFNWSALEHIVINRKFDIFDEDGTINPTRSSLFLKSSSTAPRRSVIVLRSIFLFLS